MQKPKTEECTMPIDNITAAANKAASPEKTPSSDTSHHVPHPGHGYAGRDGFKNVPELAKPPQGADQRGHISHPSQTGNAMPKRVL
jgi:hypothetical protein